VKARLGYSPDDADAFALTLPATVCQNGSSSPQNVRRAEPIFDKMRFGAANMLF
jgi:hypothetical protein